MLPGHEGLVDCSNQNAPKLDFVNDVLRAERLLNGMKFVWASTYIREQATEDGLSDCDGENLLLCRANQPGSVNSQLGLGQSRRNNYRNCARTNMCGYHSAHRGYLNARYVQLFTQLLSNQVCSVLGINMMDCYLKASGF